MSCILVVEDEEDIRTLLVEVLQEVGYTILEASSADAAVELLAFSDIQLLVTDINMPGRLNGIDLAIRARGTRPGLPVIFISGRPAMLADAYIAVDDPTALLVKPFQFAALLEKVARLAGLWALRAFGREAIALCD